MQNNQVCPKCKTSVQEIFETGFVGCEKCYEMKEVKDAIQKMYNFKKHKN